MTPLALFDRFRSDVDDGVGTMFWSDAEVLGYMEDAQQMLCRLTGGLRDATSPVTQVSIVDGEPWVALDPSIMHVRSAELLSTHRPVRILSYEDQAASPTLASSWPSNWSVEMYLDGPVTAAIIGMEEEKLRLIRIPVEDDTLALLVERLPVQTLAVDTPEELPTEFEVRKEHHLAMLMWMKHLAYGKQDAETFDKVKSDDMARAFTAYCGKAYDEKKARNHKARLIQYGGL